MTILGSHSVAEVDDLIKAKDVDINDFATKRSSLSQPPDTSWDNDFAALQSRYTSAKNDYAVQRAILVTGEFLVPNSMIVAENSYQNILGALYNAPAPAQTSGDPTPIYTDTVLPGSFQDLANRMLSAGVKVNETNIPQPNPNSDADQNALQTLNKLPVVGSKGVPWWVWPAVGVALAAGVGLIAIPAVTPLLLARRL